MSALSKKQIQEMIKEMNRPKEHKVFDWQKAAQLLKEYDPQIGFALLKTQRQRTGGIIWKNHRPVCNENTFLQSTWDVPILQMDGAPVECYTNPLTTPDQFQKHLLDDGSVGRCLGQWNAFTKWPDSVLHYLGYKGQIDGVHEIP